MMGKFLFGVTALCLCVVSEISFSAIPKNLGFDPIKNFLTEGSFRGGGAGPGFSILSVRKVASKDGRAERLIFEIGDKDGKRYSGKPGYFHAQLFRNPSEFSLDFSQTLNTKFTREQFSTLLRQSTLIASSRMETDFDDQTTNISLRFESPVKVRVFTLSPKMKSPKLVVDIVKR